MAGFYKADLDLEADDDSLQCLIQVDEISYRKRCRVGPFVKKSLLILSIDIVIFSLIQS